MTDLSTISDLVNVLGTPGAIVVLILNWYRIGRLEARVRGRNGGGLEEKLSQIEENCRRTHNHPPIYRKVSGDQVWTPRSHRK